MSMNREELENKAYQISQATFDDGTILAEIMDIHDAGHEVGIEFLPLIPNADSHWEWMKWPEADTEDFKLVKLCNQHIGGFEHLPELVGTRVKVDPDTGKIVLDGEAEEAESEEMQETSPFHRVLSVIGLIGFGIALTPIFFFLLWPVGVEPISFWQSIKMIIGGMIIFSGIYKYLDWVGAVNNV